MAESLAAVATNEQARAMAMTAVVMSRRMGISYE
jgi:hypothetical protein